MKIELKPNETVIVTFEDSDGEIEVSFGGAIPDTVSVKSDLPDTSGRVGLIYAEEYGKEFDKVIAENVEA